MQNVKKKSFNGSSVKRKFVFAGMGKVLSPPRLVKNGHVELRYEAWIYIVHSDHYSPLPSFEVHFFPDK